MLSLVLFVLEYASITGISREGALFGAPAVVDGDRDKVEVEAEVGVTATVTSTSVTGSIEAVRSNVDRTAEEEVILTREGSGRVRVLWLHGYLFFGSATRI